jgi:drug/metabolite transporter (DMT)-like permease
MILGLSLALVCALGTNLSSLFKARGAPLARPIQVRHPVRSAADLFRSRWFAVGWILALFAWGLHIEALALAPLSTVQAVLSGGLVFLAVLAERFFGFHLGRRQWGGLTLTAAGLVVIGLTSTSEGPQRSSLAALIAFESASRPAVGSRSHALSPVDHPGDLQASLEAEAAGQSVAAA